jgi:hypothetical protein
MKEGLGRNRKGTEPSRKVWGRRATEAVRRTGFSTGAGSAERFQAGWNGFPGLEVLSPYSQYTVIVSKY